MLRANAAACGSWVTADRRRSGSQSRQRKRHRGGHSSGHQTSRRGRRCGGPLRRLPLGIRRRGRRCSGPPTALPQVQQPGSPQQRQPSAPLPSSQTCPWQPHQRRVSAIADAAAPSVAATSAVSEGGLVQGEPPRRLEPPRPLKQHCEPVCPLPGQSCTALALVAPALKPTSVAPRAVCPCTSAVVS